MVSKRTPACPPPLAARPCSLASLPSSVNDACKTRPTRIQKASSEYQLLHRRAFGPQVLLSRWPSSSRDHVRRRPPRGGRPTEIRRVVAMPQRRKMDAAKRRVLQTE